MKKTMRAVAVVAAVASLGLVPAWAQAPAEAPAAAPAPTYSVATTTIADLLDKAALKAIFVKYLPDVANSPQIDQGRDLTLPDIVQYVPDQITPDKLAAIDAELKALPPQ